MKSLRDLAELEYRARAAESGDAGIKEAEAQAVEQFVWALPHQPAESAESALTANAVREKTSGWERGVCPPAVERLVVGVDIGQRACQWTAIGWEAGAIGHIINYDVISVIEGTQAPERAILSALRDWREQVLLPGWPTSAEGGPSRAAEMVLIDSGWATEAIYQFCRELDPLRLKPAKGWGTGRQQQHYHPPKERTEDRVPGEEWFLSRQPNDTWLVNIHDDYWKRWLQARFLTPAGSPGSLTLFKPEAPLTHLSFSKHITAEVEREEFKPGLGVTRKFVRLSANNHWLDATKLACVAGAMLGVKLAGMAAGRVLPVPRAAASAPADDRRERFLPRVWPRERRPGGWLKRR